MSYRNEQTAHLPALTDAELAEVEQALTVWAQALQDNVVPWLSDQARRAERLDVTRSVLTAVREARMHLGEIRPP